MKILPRLLLTVLLLSRADVGVAADAAIDLALRDRKVIDDQARIDDVAERRVRWDAKETAVVVIDVWEEHWCAGATARVEAMAPRMNAFVKTLREKGALVVHAPSDTMKYYEGTPQRRLAESAPPATPPVPIKGWRHLDKAREGALPIDDSDGGCDCEPQCATRIAWKRQHPAIEIAPADAVSDKGTEIYNLLRQRGVRHVLVVGVHTNMCILGRTFGIRQLVDEQFDVALVRDLTDTMYNSRKAPFVPHARGTDLVVEHVEKHWCPTVHSSDVLGDPKAPHVVLAINENEYDAKRTVPDFARRELEKRLGARVTVLQGEDPKSLPGTDALESADLLVIYMRRATLPEAQLKQFKAYFDSGRPVIGLRTASHAFQNWLEFDRAVLGGAYGKHFGKEGGTRVGAAADSEKFPLLRGVSPLAFQSTSWLYRMNPLAETARPLLVGRSGESDPEPVAFTNTHRGGRVFYTSLGHADDFELPAFRKLLVNAAHWALDEPIPQE